MSANFFLSMPEPNFLNAQKLINLGARIGGCCADLGLARQTVKILVHGEPLRLELIFEHDDDAIAAKLRLADDLYTDTMPKDD